ncbi:MAG TPA: hypothetical protein ENN90_15245 [Mariniphaga anaerophila]|uniref:AAA domain-containing protein n=1 Tax=Mariniphaga anaerophila TaxID=1484053 RepID=A0A831LYV0_9BACT|nr:hypothetical protein [Mariniphaga anaerophila]
MERSAYNKLLYWKNSSNRKPLIIQGARQVGKTYLIKAFGKKEYSNFISLNFEQDKRIHTLFEKSLSPEIIIEKRV